MLLRGIEMRGNSIETRFAPSIGESKARARGSKLKDPKLQASDNGVYKNPSFFKSLWSPMANLPGNIPG